MLLVYRNVIDWFIEFAYSNLHTIIVNTNNLSLDLFGILNLDKHINSNNSYIFPVQCLCFFLAYTLARNSSVVLDYSFLAPELNRNTFNVWLLSVISTISILWILLWDEGNYFILSFNMKIFLKHSHSYKNISSTFFTFHEVFSEPHKSKLPAEAHNPPDIVFISY